MSTGTGPSLLEDVCLLDLCLLEGGYTQITVLEEKVDP